MDKPRNDIKSMVEYIEQEGWEKVDEIEVKSQEEFEIEKTRIRDTEIKKLANVYNRKEEKMSRTLKAEYSRSKLRSKIRYLEAQKEIFLEIADRARVTVSEYVNDKNDKDKYKRLMRKLIVQSSLKLKEKELLIQVRKKDEQLLDGILEDVIRDYRKAAGQDISIKLDETPLPDSSEGGIILYNVNRRISVDNTIASRLQLALGNDMNSPLMPLYRYILFGENPNRRFTN